MAIKKHQEKGETLDHQSRKNQTPGTGGFKPPVRIMALSKGHSARPALQAISPFQESTLGNFPDVKNVFDGSKIGCLGWRKWYP